MPKRESSTSSTSNSYREPFEGVCRPGGGFETIIAEATRQLIDDANSEEELEVVIALRVNDKDLSTGSNTQVQSPCSSSKSACGSKYRMKVYGHFDPPPVVSTEYRGCKVHALKSASSASTLADVTAFGGGCVTPAISQRSRSSVTANDEDSACSEKEGPPSKTDALVQYQAAARKENPLNQDQTGSDGRFYKR